MAQWREHYPPTNVSRTRTRTGSRCHMQVEFVAGSLLCSERFSAGTPVFPSPQKPTFLNYISILECTGISERVLVNFLGAPWVNKLQIFLYIYIHNLAISSSPLSSGALITFPWILFSVIILLWAMSNSCYLELIFVSLEG